MNKQEFIEKLKQHGAWCTECHDINGEADRYVKAAKVRELLEQLDELQVEKVEVTEEQAELLRAFTGESIYELLANCLGEDEELMAKAKLFGYTVKPTQWVVRQGGSEVWYLQGFRNSLDGDIVKQWCSHKGCVKFTDKSKAEAVATLVEGTVEEV